MELSIVQDYSCLVSTAEILLSDDMRKIAEKDYVVYDSECGNKETVSPIGKLYQMEEQTIDNAAFTVRIMKYRTMLGQTLYTKKYSKKQQEKLSAINKTMEGSDWKTAENRYRKNSELRVNAELARKLQGSSQIGKVTFNKVLKIFTELLENDVTAAVAKKMKADRALVECIRNMMV